MPSVIGLLEKREGIAAQRVEALRAEAGRVLAELREAEFDWGRFVVSRETAVEVLAGPDGVQDVAAGGVGAVAGVSADRGGAGRRQDILDERGTGDGAAGGWEVRTKAEGVWSKTRRLVDRGRLVRRPSGRFALAVGL
ncbi:hypothetical protein [Streptomyces sp. NPDC060198]|uniref:hypothetical protein n=1 Tax=Streptomyces sp. NPDC060198 TaxID=3347070 RepID=UPI003669ACB8